MKIYSKKSLEKEGYYDLFVEDIYICNISEKIYFKYSFYEEKDMSMEEFSQMKWQIDYIEARSIGIKFLSRALKTEKEIMDRLKEENFEKSVIDSAIKELKILKYLDDKLYTEKYIRSKLKLKPRSYLMLKKQLIDKGINEKLIDDELDDYGHDNYEMAKILVGKKFKKEFYNQANSKNKVISFLKNRGFDTDTIKKIILNIDINN